MRVIGAQYSSVLPFLATQQQAAHRCLAIVWKGHLVKGVCLSSFTSLFYLTIWQRSTIKLRVPVRHRHVHAMRVVPLVAPSAVALPQLGILVLDTGHHHLE